MSEQPDFAERVTARARELYEASRKRVSGRPRWEKLDPSDDYDMGMKDHAMYLATYDLAWEEHEATQP